MNGQRPGAALVAAVRNECKNQGKTIGHLAGLLGVSATYWATICSGNRSIQPMVEKPRACRVFADFLRVPRINVMQLAELVLQEDFVVEQSLDDQLNGVYLQMANDALWSTLVPKPAAWDDADRGMKLLVVSLYQAALLDSMLQKARKTVSSGLLAPREGLAPAPDQVGKWGLPLRPAM
jgi:transcriptional regulator with XRE-family HTH domain